MTVPCLAEPAPARDLDAAVDAVRSRGLRLSASRRLVLEALFAAGRPATAEEIASGMYGRLPRCDLASVYRNLEMLEELGVVRHFHAGHGPGHYVLAGDGAREYLACERCGALEAVDPRQIDSLREEVRARFGFEVGFAHFPMVGSCAACAAGSAGR